jgi:hypothetical protein
VANQIEPAMVFQIGLPTLILREDGMVSEGILEKGVTALYMPVFNLNTPSASYLLSAEWGQIFKKWEHQVESVREREGRVLIL